MGAQVDFELSPAVLIGGIGIAVTMVLAAMARDRTLFHAVNTAKDDARKLISDGLKEVHDRITRVRDNSMSLREAEALEKRVEKALDELKAEQRRMLERLEAQGREAAARTESGFREVKQMISSIGSVTQREIAEN